MPVVVPRDVVYRREAGVSAADAAVWTPVIVIREQPRQRIEPFIIGVVRSLVGPLGLHDLVERLRLAIRLRPGASQPTPFDQLGAGHGGQACVTMGSMRMSPVTVGFGYTTATVRPLTCQQPLWEIQLAARESLNKSME